MKPTAVRSLTRWAAVPIAVLACSIALAQDSLTLEEALQLAKQRNGSVIAALLGVQSAKSRQRAAFGSFLPELAPTYRHDLSRNETFTGPGRGVDRSTTKSFDLALNWRLFDNGARSFTYLSSKRDTAAQEASALQTLRSTLLQVYQRYYEALRAQELLRVAQAQVVRAEEILKQTRLRVELKDAPEKDILQAEADALNARAAALGAQNAVATSAANLKATIGWSERDDLPELQRVEAPNLQDPGYSLDDAYRRGLAGRPDLLSQRNRIEAQRFDLRLAQTNSTVSFSVDATYRKSLLPDVADRAALTLLATIPLYDGHRTSEGVRIQRLGLESSQALLYQLERDVRAEIESAYKEYVFNRQRLVATDLALKAARVNFEAASAAQKAGAQGTNLITVQTAQISLVTAESNYVQAVHDSLISDVRLKVAIGEAIPGE